MFKAMKFYIMMFLCLVVTLAINPEDKTDVGTSGEPCIHDGKCETICKAKDCESPVTPVPRRKFIVKHAVVDSEIMK